MMRWLASAVTLVLGCGSGSKPPADAAPAPRPVVMDARPPIDATPVDPGVTSTGQVKRGDMIIKIFKRHGVVGEEANEVIQALKGKMNFKRLQPGQPYTIVQRDGRLLAFELRLAETATVKVVRGPDEKLTVAVE